MNHLQNSQRLEEAQDAQSVLERVASISHSPFRDDSTLNVEVCLSQAKPQQKPPGSGLDSPTAD